MFTQKAQGYLAFLLIFMGFILHTPYVDAATTISNISSDKTSVGKYEKIEWSFDLSKNYPNPYYYYDAGDTPANNPSTMSWHGVDGVSVDMKLISPSGKSISVPGFWMEDYTRVRDSNLNAEVLGRNGNGRWRVRFAPSEVGSYSYYITVVDKDGTSRYPTSGSLSFSATETGKKGYIRTSSKDSRFMAYENGSPFVPIAAGHQFLENGQLRSYEFEDVFNTLYGPNKINMLRIWDHADFGLGVEGAQPVWINGSTTNGTAQGVEIGTTNVRSGLRSAKPTSTSGWYQRVAITEKGVSHKLTVWIKTNSVSGGGSFVSIRTGSLYNTGTVVAQTPAVSGTTNWTQYTITFTPTTNFVTVNLLASASGATYIDDITLGPVDTSGNISYNIVSDPDFERHFAKDNPGNDPNSNRSLARPLGNFFNQWASYSLDKIIESAEKNGVAIQLCSCSGPWFTWPTDPDQWTFGENWVLKSWQRNIRYRIARWGYSPAVLAWEDHNEFGHIVSGSSLYSFQANYTNYIKANDPYRHQITTSQGSQAYSPGAWSNLNFDLANYHDYMMSSRYPAALTNDEANFVYRFAWCFRQSSPSSGICSGLGLGDGSSWNGNPKPWVWGEIGVGTTVWDQPNSAGTTGEGGRRALHNSMWAGLFSPIGTTPIDWYFTHEDSYVKQFKFIERKHAAAFFEGVDYDGGNFVYLMTTNDAPPAYTGETVSSSNTTARVYAMRRQDKKAAYAWVMNRNNTWATAPSVPAQISSSISIPNMNPSTSYKVEIWNTHTGAILSTQQLTSGSNGTITFSISSLTDDVAVKIESSTGIPTSSPTPTMLTTPSTAPKIGDANGDNKVDGIDYVIWLTKYNQSVAGPANGDFNNDGTVDGVDYVVWLTNYGK